MQRKRSEHHDCPVARCVDQIGDWWSILILRDALRGTTRFDVFQKSLGIAPTILTRRLKGLVDDGLLVRHRYNEHPPRDEYLLTEKGQDFQPVLFALLAWGNKHFASQGKSVVLMNTQSGTVVDPVLVDESSGVPIQGQHYQLVCLDAAQTEAIRSARNARAVSPAE